VAEENASTPRNAKAQVGTGERNERIRTYNFPQNRVTDPSHRTDPLQSALRDGRRSGRHYRTAHGQRLGEKLKRLAPGA